MIYHTIYHIISYHITSHHITSHHIIYYIILYYIILYYIILYYITVHYNLTGPPSYIRFVVDRNVVMRRMTVNLIPGTLLVTKLMSVPSAHGLRQPRLSKVRSIRTLMYTVT